MSTPVNKPLNLNDMEIWALRQVIDEAERQAEYSGYAARRIGTELLTRIDAKLDRLQKKEEK